MTKALTITGIAIFFVFSLLLLSFSQGETLTITTYYPSPYGSYNQLQTNSLGVGDNDGDGSLDSGDVPNPTTDPGDVWIAGNVGIGTTSPDEKFEVEWVAGGTDAEIGRGTTDTDITFIALRNANGTKCYIYPNAAGDGIVVSTTKP